jgi:hypothetical protein
MMQNLYFANQNPSRLGSSGEGLTSQHHEFIRYLYQPVVDVAEWASFLLLNNDIKRDYERHLEPIPKFDRIKAVHFYS